MIADARAAAYPRQPQIEEARLTCACRDADEMEQNRQPNRPDRMEDQEELGRDNPIPDKIGIGDAGEHLRTGQRHEAGIALDRAHLLASKTGGCLDSADDACRSEQNEAAEDHRRPIAPVYAAGEH